MNYFIKPSMEFATNSPKQESTAVDVDSFAGENYDDWIALLSGQSPPHHRSDGGPHNPDWVAMKEKQSHWLPEVIQHYIYGGPQVTSSINGNNGSATNTDDHAKKMANVKKEIAKAVVKEEHKMAARKAINPRRNKSQVQQPPRNQGLSDSVVSVAAAYSRRSTTRAPKITREGDNTRIVHKELISNVVGSGTWTPNGAFNTAISCNPGMSGFFPWLAGEANGFEKYRFNKLVFRYKPRCGSSTPGSVALIPDYDAADPAPVSEIAASSYCGVEEDVPWKEIVLEMDMRRSSEKFIRFGPLLANLDIKTYDLANVFVGTTDGTGVSWGKLWAEYDVTLINPQQNLAIAGVGIVDNGGITSATAPLGASPTVINGSNIVSVSPGISTVSLTNLIVGAEYMATAEVDGTAITSFSWGITSLSPVTLSNSLNGTSTVVLNRSTYTATATSATIRPIVAATTVTNCIITFGLIPIGLF
jgi:hypothetical protein